MKIFNKFCQTILINPEIKQQIYSLQLSNDNTCGQIQRFLSIFPLNEFSNLRLLKLSKLQNENTEKLELMLPFLSKLFSFHILNSSIKNDDFINSIPISNLRTLTILRIRFFGQPSDLIKLTIITASLEHLLFHLFKYFPLLKYLYVQYVSKYNYPIQNDISTDQYPGLHLKQLIIENFDYHFNQFEIFAKLTPNLKSLTIHSSNNISMMHPFKWKDLIQSSLSKLNTFKFNFSSRGRHDVKEIVERFKHFQSAFWCKQHQWYTEGSVEQNLICIYTIPYMSNYYISKKECGRLRNKLSNTSILYDNVKCLTIYEDIINDKFPDHFPNVESLNLKKSNPNQSTINIDCLKMIVNLSNLNHLNILEYGKMFSPSLLLEILKQTPKLSWITIDSKCLNVLFDNDELCGYLNRMIKRIDLGRFDDPSFNNIDDMTKFCEIFSNIEQILCHDIELDDILFLLNNLTKLSSFNFVSKKLNDHEYFQTFFEEQSRISNFIYRLEDRYSTTNLDLSIWK